MCWLGVPAGVPAWGVPASQLEGGYVRVPIWRPNLRVPPWGVLGVGGPRPNLELKSYPNERVDSCVFMVLRVGR